MLTNNDTIHGWSPTGGDDEDVSVSQDTCFTTIRRFSSSSSTFLSPICPPLEPTPQKTCPPHSQSTPLAPLTSISHSPVAPSSDRRAQRNRNRDPSWIPRPRNAFIIFRCEYSREHAQGSQESQNDNDPTTPSVKTLSKRAADAWKQLSPSEKDRYKVLADKEREEHARLYPHYRFRPMKRQASGAGRTTSCERSRGPAAVSAERPPALSAHLPSVLASAPPKLHRDPSVEQAGVVAPMPHVPAAPLPEPLSYPVDPQADLPMALTAGYNDSVLFYPSSEATLPSDSSRPPAELYSPLCMSTASVAPDIFRCNDSAFDLDMTHEDLERAQALEAYAIGLYNFDLFSPFAFPEYC